MLNMRIAMAECSCPCCWHAGAVVSLRASQGVHLCFTLPILPAMLEASVSTTGNIPTTFSRYNQHSPCSTPCGRSRWGP